MRRTSTLLSVFCLPLLFCTLAAPQLGQADDGIVAPAPPIPGQYDPAGEEPADEDAGQAEAELASLLNFNTQPIEPAPVPLFEAGVSDPTAALDLSTSVFGNANVARSLLSSTRQARSQRPATDVVLGGEARFRAATDAGNLLKQSRSASGLSAQQRNPIVTDPRVRGSQVGQLIASGSYWFPVRQDLDTLLSKIDSRVISDTIIVKGPYSSLYGPGYNFIDIQLLSTPRYYNGYESHGSTSIEFKSNGEQWYGRHTFWGGGEDYGYRIGYGYRTGNDYEAGNGIELPSSYKSGDLDFAYGWDPDEDTRVEFNYLRLDQDGVEIPSQIFDIDYLKTDAFELRFTRNCGSYCDLLQFEAWHNQTEFNGNAQGAGKRRQIPFLDASGFFGRTTGDNSSTGASLATTWGDVDWSHLTLGADVRYLRQQLWEFDRTTGPVIFPVGVLQNVPIPRAYQANPGLFAEAGLPLSDCFRVKTGGRIDWVNMNAARFAPGINLFGDPDLPTFNGGPNASFDQSFDLYQGFITAQLDLTDIWSMNVGGGYGMRAPTMTELYADGPFITVMPQFAGTSPVGNPFLRPERRWQVDLGVNADYGDVRFGATGFHAWVKDYVTLDLLVLNPAGIPVYQFVNTSMATLAGGEVFGEADLLPGLTAFGTMSYVEGRDQRRAASNAPIRNLFFGNQNRSGAAASAEPLPVIYPLQARLGLRLHDPEFSLWGVELSARIVDNQDRVAATLLETATPGFTIFDLRGFWQVTDQWTWVAGVENIGDRTYREHFDPRVFSSVFQPGSNFYFGAERVY